MAENLKLARLYLLLLAIAAVGRWLFGTFGVPYAKGHHVFSIVTLTLYSAIFYGAFSRRWRHFRLWRAAGLGIMLGVMSQLVILAATLLSYALGLHTYYNNPVALEVLTPEASFTQAMLSRLAGLIVNPILSGIAAAIGWAIGGLLPEA